MEPSFDLLDFSKAKSLFELGYNEGIVWAEQFKAGRIDLLIETEIS
jgi:hypothetical protein